MGETTMIAAIEPREYGAGEFLALLLRQIGQFYDDNTDDFTSMHALDIAIAAIAADENLDEKSAKKILESMSLLADWMLRVTSELSLNTRARLEAIRDTHPDFGGPATTGVAS
jgi:hypothetical protein